jgi:hypothetical protein
MGLADTFMRCAMIVQSVIVVLDSLRTGNTSIAVALAMILLFLATRWGEWGGDEGAGEAEDKAAGLDND